MVMASAKLSSYEEIPMSTTLEFTPAIAVSAGEKAQYLHLRNRHELPEASCRISDRAHK